MAGVLPARGVVAVRTPGAAAWGCQRWPGDCQAAAGELASQIEKQAWDGQWYRRAWFDNGDPLGSAQNAECRIDSRSPRAGPPSPVWATPSAAGWRWMPCGASWCAGSAESSNLSARRSIAPKPIPATSRRTRPACAKTAGSIPTARYGRHWLLRWPDAGNRPRRWCRCSTPSITRWTRRRSKATRSNLTCSRRTSTANLRMPAAEAGPGTPARRHGTTGCCTRSSSGSSDRWTRCVSGPGFRPRGPGFKVHYRYCQTFYHLVFTQDPTTGGPARLTLDGRPLKDGTVNLVNDKRDAYRRGAVRASHRREMNRVEVGSKHSGPLPGLRCFQQTGSRRGVNPQGLLPPAWASSPWVASGPWAWLPPWRACLPSRPVRPWGAPNGGPR